VLAKLDRDEDGQITWDEFEKTIIEDATTLDRRVYPLAGAMFSAGLSVGTVVPILPVIVHDLGMGPAEFGLAVSAFGLTKLLANVPAAGLVESKGRQPLLVGGLVLGGGFASLAAAGGTAGLAASRALSGVGVTGLVTAINMMAADISTPLSRASTMAPVMAGFNGGMILGPALGGALAHAVGPEYTCVLVGGVLALNAVAARSMLAETRGSREIGDAAAPPQSQTAREVVDELRTSWDASPEIRRLGLANLAFFATIAGVNMTVLPLVLTGDLGLSPGAVGSLFAIQAAVSLVATLPVAKLADRVGPANLIPAGLATAGVAFAALPFATGFEHVAGIMALQGLGSCVLGSAPTAAAANAVGDEHRAAALSLVRVTGDLGMLLGSAGLGAFAAAAGSDYAFGAASVLLFGTAARFQLGAPKRA